MTSHMKRQQAADGSESESALRTCNSLTRAALCGLLVAAGLAVTACDGLPQTEPISAETTCGDYLQRPGAERSDAAIRISAEVDGVSNPGNPMWALSLDGACGSNPSLTLGEYFDPSQ